jgi:hypothetical protein
MKGFQSTPAPAPGERIFPRPIFQRTAVTLMALLLLTAFGATAQTTNNLSTAEIQGRALAQKILQQLQQPPAENSTNTGVLEIRDAKHKRTQIPLAFKIIVTETNWQTVYEANTPDGLEKLSIIRAPFQPAQLVYDSPVPFSASGDAPELDHPFAKSDFLIGDLDLAFFGWPGQKVLRREVHRSCGCTVLESTNPAPSANGYSRVETWIDNDSLGIVEAYAYDTKGKLLKDFEPKDLKKVNGRYQVQTMLMENVQTGTRTRMEFNLKP